MKNWMRRAALAVVLGAAASGAAWAALTAEERVWAHGVAEQADDVRATGEALLADPALTPEARDSALRIRDASITIRESMLRLERGE